MEENKKEHEGMFPIPNFGFKIELVNMPKAEQPMHPMPSMELCNFINQNFGRGFGLKLQPREVKKEEKIEFLKKHKELLEEKLLKIGEQLKDLKKPLKKEKKVVKKKGVKK